MEDKNLLCPKCNLTIEQRKKMYLNDCSCEDSFIGNEEDKKYNVTDLINNRDLEICLKCNKEKKVCDKNKDCVYSGL